MLLALAACIRLDEPEIMTPEPAPEGERVKLSFSVVVPDDGVSTKAMGNNPTIDTDGFYIAVFGGSGFFNEWVKATVTQATANYDGTTATKYRLDATLSVSDSRLRLHFLANCPTEYRSSPPISGSQDTEENVISKIRTKKTATYNDGYWQKIILPNGVKAVKENNVYVATNETLAQIPNPVVLVRNFARVYLRNLTPIVGDSQLNNSHQLVTIKKYALAYAPSEGVIAPILSAPYSSNATGAPITVADDDETTPVYFENFFINYQNYPIASTDPNATLLSSAPFYYEGYSPEDQAYDYYPNNSETGVPVLSDMTDWDDEHPENNVLYVYERTIPSSAHRATRIIILAERRDQNSTEPGDAHSEGDKYYALDIVNTQGVTIPLLRNQTYTVHLLNIEAGSGETDLDNAALASSATVSGDPDFQNLINISDGKSSIGTSFTEKFYVEPQEDFVMFRYIPTNITDDNYTANKEGNELVTIQVGSVNTSTGVFTQLTPAEAASQGILTFKTENGEYKVWINKDGNNNVINYVRSNNTWVVATSAQMSDASVEKWGMIKYQLNESYVDGENHFTQERVQAIHVAGTYGGKEMSRNVVIKTSPRQQMHVECLQKYVLGAAGEQETLRVMIPKGLSRSLFPLDFFIEAAKYSLTPDGDQLPVDYGTSIVPDNNEPAFYFVKTLTQEAYDALSEYKDENDVTWKVFDCYFKTTIPENACRIYVRNRYFSDLNSSDEFFNYLQRKFSAITLAPASFAHGENVTCQFELDPEHSGGTIVWWDPENLLGQSNDAEEALTKGLSTSNRVLPPIMTVTLNGLLPRTQADGITYVTGGLEHQSGRTYLYYVGSGSPTSDKVSVTLELVADAAVGGTASVSLSTVNITGNPTLYEPRSSSTITVIGSNFQNPTGFSWTAPFYETGDHLSLNITYKSGIIVPITITLTGAVPDGTDNRISGSNGTYTFTPTAANISGNVTSYTLGLVATAPNGGVSATIGVNSAYYYSQTATHAALTGISLNKSSTSINGVGNSETLTASFTPSGLDPAPIVHWASSDESVATVSASGVVTAVASGTTTITARAGSCTATCTVRVKRKVWHAASYTLNLKTNNTDNSTISYTTSPQNVSFEHAPLGGSRNNYYRTMGERSWGTNYNGTYTVTAPTGTNYNEARIIGLANTYNGNNNSSNTVTYKSGNTTLTPSSKTSWGTTNTNSTTEVSGYDSITVTFSFVRNGTNHQLNGVTVYYGYYTYED
jgi:uncharacterized protein YjdB